MRQASAHSGSAHNGVRPSPLGAFRPEARSRGSRRLAGRFRRVDGRLPGKIGPTSLLDPRGILFRGLDGEGAHWSLARYGDGDRA
jgi:hypothetical protein